MRTLCCFVLLLVFCPSAYAISELKREWEGVYLSKASDEYKAAVKAVKCAICHKKSGDKKLAENRNEYGTMMSKFLKSKKVTISDLKKEYKDPSTKEAAKKKIKYMFDKVGEQKSKDGDRFIDKIKADKLPATDAE